MDEKDVSAPERKSSVLADAAGELGLNLALESADKIAAASVQALGEAAAGATEMALSVATSALEASGAAAEAAVTVTAKVVGGILEGL